MHHLQLLKNVKTASNTDVNPDVNPDTKPDVNSDVKPDTNLDINPAVKCDLNYAVQSNLTHDVKPELLPISSIEAGCHRQKKSSLETSSSFFPFPITTLSYNFHSISYLYFTYHPNLYHIHIIWIQSILPTILLLMYFLI